MSKERLITKTEMVCPICGKTHLIEEKTRKTKTIIKGKSVQYDQTFYYCSNASDEEKSL